jgi:hypothetical protein
MSGSGNTCCGFAIEESRRAAFHSERAMRPERPILMGRYKLLSAVFRCQVILDCLGIFADPGLDRR